jgi:hypothetical protein
MPSFTHNMTTLKLGMEIGLCDSTDGNQSSMYECEPTIEQTVFWMKYSNQLVWNSVKASKYAHDTMPFNWTGKFF